MRHTSRYIRYCLFWGDVHYYIQYLFCRSASTPDCCRRIKDGITQIQETISVCIFMLSLFLGRFVYYMNFLTFLISVCSVSKGSACSYQGSQTSSWTTCTIRRFRRNTASVLLTWWRGRHLGAKTSQSKRLRRTLSSYWTQGLWSICYSTNSDSLHQLL